MRLRLAGLMQHCSRLRQSSAASQCFLVIAWDRRWRHRKKASRCFHSRTGDSDKENAYFADGIQDEILTRLSKIADLKVISRTSTQHYKSAPENLSEIARQLGVAHIWKEACRRAVMRAVNVQLIKAAIDSHFGPIVRSQIDRHFSVESEVAKAMPISCERN